MGDDEDALRDLAAWAAGERAAAAAEQRVRERSLRAQAEESATVHGVLLDLAERARALACRTTGGRTVRGIVTEVGSDVVVVADAVGGVTLVAIAAITSLRPEPSDGGDEHGRPAPPAPARAARVAGRSLGAALGDAAAARARVVVSVAGGEDRVAGELRAVGHDVVTVLTGESPASVVHVPLSAIESVVIVDRTE